MSRRLHLATLEDLESHPPVQPIRSQGQSRGLGAAPAGRTSRSHSHVGQIKYNLSADSSLVDRVAFRVYLSIFRWFKRHFNFIVPTQQTVHADGSVTYGWLEHQGCFEDEVSAKQDAARYAFGFVVHVPIGRSYPSDTIEGDYEFVSKGTMLVTQLHDEARELRAAVKAVRFTQ